MGCGTSTSVISYVSSPEYSISRQQELPISILENGMESRMSFVTHRSLREWMCLEINKNKSRYLKICRGVFILKCIDPCQSHYLQFHHSQFSYSEYEVELRIAKRKDRKKFYTNIILRDGLSKTVFHLITTKIIFEPPDISKIQIQLRHLLNIFPEELSLIILKYCPISTTQIDPIDFDDLPDFDVLKCTIILSLTPDKCGCQHRFLI